ncbi:alpha/beta hydrolase [Xanthobacter sp. V3C-3]|uniref:alpha/beta fold hydrolase n=1 Tax=Xanthobacter lutulentifluminis TaxID=3119935 RepID=UPI00372B7FD1
MATITTADGARIFYKDWGPKDGQPIVFSHGWPLSADAWDAQMVFFANEGFRTIAHDRRSHGRSDQVWSGNTMDQYADDLAELINGLNLKDAILVGHSTGGGEVTRYVGRHGTARVAKLALIGAVPPLMLKTEANPGGLPLAVFDAIRKGTYDNRSQFFRDLTIPFYGYNREGAQISEGIRESFWLQGMMGGLKGQLDSIRAFSESDFHADLKRFDKPTLVLHGDDDQIVPIGASALETAKLVPHAELKVYRGADHGLTQTHQDRFNADLLAFING